MPYAKGEPFLAQFTDPATGLLMSSGTVEFFVANTSTPTPYYTDIAGTGGGTSLTLNAGGQPENDIYFDTDITYDIVVTPSGGTPVTTQDYNVLNGILSGDLLDDLREALDTVQSYSDMTAFINATVSGDDAYIKSYQAGWAASVAGPKGSHYRHRTGATSASPSVGSPVAVSTIGTGTQAGYAWDAAGTEFYISTQDGVFTPEMFGAIAGVTNSKAAIEDSIRVGKTRIVDSYSSSGISLSNLASVDIECTDEGSITLLASSDVASVKFEDCTDVQIKDLVIDGNKAGQTQGNFANRLDGCGLYVTGFSNCEVDGVKVSNASSGAGILVEDPTAGANVRTHTNVYAKVSNCKVFDSGLSGSPTYTCDGIYTQCNNIEVSDNEVIDFNDYGIVLEFAHNMKAFGNSIDGNFKGVYGVSVQGVFNFDVYGNEIKRCGGGIAPFVQSNPVADPYFSIFGSVYGNTITQTGTPVSAGNNYPIHVSQFGATITVVAQANGTTGNSIAVSQTGGNFSLPTGGTLAGGAFGVPANGTISLSSVVATDTLTVNGVTFTAVSSGATGNQFNVGSTDEITAENLASIVQASTAGVDCFFGCHINCYGNNLDGGERGLVYNAHNGAVYGNHVTNASAEQIRVQGHRVRADHDSKYPNEICYMNVTAGQVRETRNNIQRRSWYGEVTNPAYGRPYYVKTEDTTGNKSCVAVIRASGEHPTGPAAAFAERRLLIKSAAGTVTVTDFDGGAVGDSSLITITGGQNGTGRAELLVRPSTGTMSIAVDIELFSLDYNDAFRFVETA